MEKPKILFIHNKCKQYRKPIFNILAEKLNVSFFFTDEKKVECLRADYKIINRHGFGPLDFLFGLMYVTLGEKYDLIVLPPADSPRELFANFICFLVTKIRRKPFLIWSERWRFRESKKSFIRQFYLAFDEIVIGFIFRNASACITDGKKHKEYLVSLNVPENRIFIAPHASVIEGVNDNTDINKIKDELGIGNKKVILYVGRLIKLKGVNFLIEAFAKMRAEIKDVHLLIIGREGMYGRTREERLDVNELKVLSEDLGLKMDRDISFLGDIIRENLTRYFLICDVFVMPGITYMIADAWGLVLNEAMQFGKPVISTDAVGAAYDLIEDGINGYMVPEKDVEALCAALIKVLSDPKLQEKMGKESRRIISRYKYEDMFRGFDKAINYALRLIEE
jgi:glycosyltransferase involved in cell wall biosynthesis